MFCIDSVGVVRVPFRLVANKSPAPGRPKIIVELPEKTLDLEDTSFVRAATQTPMRTTAIVGAAAVAAASYLVYRALTKREPKLVTLEAAAPAASSASSASSTTPAKAAPSPTPAAAVAEAAKTALSSAPAAATAVTPVPFALGTAVRLCGLQSKPELNGQRARVVGWDEAKGRCNVALRGGKMLQIRPANIEEDDKKLTIEEMDSGDLINVTLAKHDGLTAAHASRVVELLRTATTPVDAGNLLRCICCCEWIVAALQHKGETKVEPFQHESMGSGLLLATTTERCVQLAAVAPKPPSGSARVAVKLHAHKLFAESSLQARRAARNYPLSTKSIIRYAAHACCVATACDPIAAIWLPPTCEGLAAGACDGWRQVYRPRRRVGRDRARAKRCKLAGQILLTEAKKLCTRVKCLLPPPTPSPPPPCVPVP